MNQATLYDECPLCNQGAVIFDENSQIYRCDHCGLALKKRALLGLFKKDHLGVVSLGEGDFSLAEQSLANLSLPPDRLKVVIGNVYSDEQLAQIAGGSQAVIRPVRTVLAQIILEQLKETCYLQVNGLRRAHGQPLPEAGDYRPQGLVPRSGLEWQDQGNLFGTDKHLVLPSDSFTFIRLDRKLGGVQAFNDGVAVQRKDEDFAAYFVGCYPHEAALTAAFVLGKQPALRQK